MRRSRFAIQALRKRHSLQGQQVVMDQEQCSDKSSIGDSAPSVKLQTLTTAKARARSL